MTMLVMWPSVACTKTHIIEGSTVVLEHESAMTITWLRIVSAVYHFWPASHAGAQS